MNINKRKKNVIKFGRYFTLGDTAYDKIISRGNWAVAPRTQKIEEKSLQKGLRDKIGKFLSWCLQTLYLRTIY